MDTLWHLKLIFFLFIFSILVNSCIVKPPSKPQILYVNPPVTYLRDAPDFKSAVLTDLFVGDQVEFIDMTDTGWCKVRSARTNLSGWIPRELLVDAPPPLKGEIVEPPKKPNLPIYYVAVVNLKLREHPTNNSKIIKVLQFNNRVEKVDESPNGWFQVREPETDVTGWASKDNFEGFILKKPRLIGGLKGEPIKGEQEKKPPKKLLFLALCDLIINQKLSQLPQIK